MCRVYLQYKKVLFNQFMITANAYTHVCSHVHTASYYSYHHAILGFERTLLTLIYYMSPPVLANTATYLITTPAVTEKNDSACVGV
jgi:hypothetical protein